MHFEPTKTHTICVSPSYPSKLFFWNSAKCKRETCPSKYDKLVAKQPILDHAPDVKIPLMDYHVL